MRTGARDSEDFPTTWWTLIDQAAVVDSATSDEALEQLIHQYEGPLRAHLTARLRLQADVADDLIQSFIADKFLARYLLQHADRAKGRFRSLLLRSLQNYYLEWRRKHAAQPKCAPTTPGDTADPSRADVDAFDIAWARQLINEVLSSMRSDCLENQQESIWQVFEGRLLRPLRECAEPMSYEEVCRQFGFRSPEQASNALMTAKRKFQRIFARVSARHRHDGEESDDVLREVVDIFARSGPLDWRRVPAAGEPGQGPAPLVDADPSSIVRLLDSATSAGDLWRDDELSALLRHQLSQRLADLGRHVAACAEQACAALANEAPLNTLQDLFEHPTPSVELLDAVKRYGRARANDPASLLQPEVASAIYFASIAAALVRYRQRITSSDDDILRAAFERMRQQPWVSPTMKELFSGAMPQP